LGTSGVFRPLSCHAAGAAGITDCPLKVDDRPSRIALIPRLKIVLARVLPSNQSSRVARATHRRSTGKWTMNLDRVRGHLKQLAGRLKQRWGRRTGDTHREIEGKHDELIGKIQEVYGIARDEAGRQARDRGRAH